MTAIQRLLTGRSAEFSDNGGGSESLLLTAFFAAQGLLPANTLFEALYDFPPPDFTNDNGGTRALSMSRMRFACANNATANFGWDIGAAQSEVLAIIGAVRPRNASVSVFLCSTLPAAGEIPDGSYVYNLNSSGSRWDLYKKAAGSFTTLGNELSWGPGDTVDEVSTGVAVYYNDATNRLIMFVRQNNSMWSPVIDITDSSFTTMRYVGLRIGAVGTPVMWTICPIAIYFG